MPEACTVEARRAATAEGEVEMRFQPPSSLRAAQIGASGVLLIQYRLLKHGIESAPMTTDRGIDLVVYAPKIERALTVQVKTCLKPKAAGGKGRPSLDWWLLQECPAEFIGLVNLQSDMVWMFSKDEFRCKAQQSTPDRLHLYFYVEDDYKAKPKTHISDFVSYRLEHRLPTLFENLDTTFSGCALTSG